MRTSCICRLTTSIFDFKILGTVLSRRILCIIQNWKNRPPETAYYRGLENTCQTEELWSYIPWVIYKFSSEIEKCFPLGSQKTLEIVNGNFQYIRSTKTASFRKIFLGKLQTDNYPPIFLVLDNGYKMKFSDKFF